MKQGTNDSHWMDLMISHLLRAGVVIAGVLLFVGWVWELKAKSFSLESFKTYQAQSLIDSIHGALATQNIAALVCYAGLIILVCLPLSRVLMTGILFIRDKDYALAVMALVVFVALVGSFSLGLEI